MRGIGAGVRQKVPGEVFLSAKWSALKDTPVQGVGELACGGGLHRRHRFADFEGERAGLSDRKGVVEREQRLLRHRGLSPLGVRGVGRGKIKGGEHRIHLDPVNEAVDCPPTRKGLCGERNGPPPAGGIQIAADRQHGIAHRLYIETPPVGAPEPCVVGVGCRGLGAFEAALLVGGAQDNVTDQPFCGPSALHQCGCQPVQQFRVCRGFGLETEVARGFYKGASEQMPPDLICPDTGREGIGGSR